MNSWPAPRTYAIRVPSGDTPIIETGLSTSTWPGGTGKANRTTGPGAAAGMGRSNQPAAPATTAVTATAPTSRSQREPPTTVVAVSFSRVTPRGSARIASISTRASAIACKRLRGFFVRQRSSKSFRRGCRFFGNRLQSGSVFSTSAKMCGTDSPLNNGSREHLVEHDAERPDIRPLIGGLTARLLGAHVPGRAENQAGLSHRETQRRRMAERRLVRIARERFRETEVEHLDLTATRDHDVRGLQVPMHDAFLVRGFERSRDLQRKTQRILDRQRTVFELALERLAFDELHREEPRAVVLVQPIDRRDVRVIQGCEQFGFALEACEAVGVFGELARQRFDRDLAAELRVARAINLAHAADADQAGDLISAEDGCPP